MKHEFTGQRIAVLVDTANMYHSAKSRFQRRVDYRQLLKLIVNERQLVRAVAFVERNEDSEITPFVDALKGVGFETRVKTIRRHPDQRPHRGDWDVGITLHAVELAKHVDAIALVTGNGVFIDLIDYLYHHGVRSEIYAFEGCVSGELIQSADRWYPIGEDWLMP